MLTLNDGRTELWQWDTGGKLTVDADCTQVHFSNKVFGRSIDVDVVDGVAIIPDILLQTDKELNVWAFVGTAENGYTKISKAFKVNRRNKPADYVFTPPEQTTLQELVERLAAIEESQDPDAIKNAVDEYLANNPIQIDEKDPTVPDWAKHPVKPKYTAKEVGAVATVNGVAPDENGNVELPDSGITEEKELASASVEYVEGENTTMIFPELTFDMFHEGETVIVYDNGIRYEGKLVALSVSDGSAGLGAGDIFTDDFPFCILLEEGQSLKIVFRDTLSHSVLVCLYNKLPDGMLPDSIVKTVNGKTGEVELTSEDVGAISQDDLQEATDKALAQAKESGAFDGADGKDGADGQDGYTPVKGVDYMTPDEIQASVEQVSGIVMGQICRVSVVMPEIGNAYADKTSSEIYAAWQAKAPIYCYVDLNDGEIPLMLSPFVIKEETAIFAQISKTYGSTTCIMVTITGNTVEIEAFDVATKEDIPTDSHISTLIDEKIADIPQGGGSAGWETINTLTLEEDSNSVIIDKDSNGNSFELSTFMFYIDRVASGLQTDNSTLYVGNSSSGYFGQMQGQTANQTRIWMYGEFMTNHMWQSAAGNNAGGSMNVSISYVGGCAKSAPMIRLYGYYFGAGTKITLYGVRK